MKLTTVLIFSALALAFAVFFTCAIDGCKLHDPPPCSPDAVYPDPCAAGPRPPLESPKPAPLPCTTLDAAVDASAPDAAPPAPGPCTDAHGIYHMPNPAWTPGALCSAAEKDFDGYRYPGRIPHCTRNITAAEKDRVAQRYGIPKADYALYEFDHFVPLAAGGANADTNLWPQTLAEAHEKDRVEDAVYRGLYAGTMTQDEALAKLRAWRPASCPP